MPIDPDAAAWRTDRSFSNIELRARRDTRRHPCQVYAKCAMAVSERQPTARKLFRGWALAEGLDRGAEVVLDLIGVLAVERQTEDDR